MIGLVADQSCKIVLFLNFDLYTDNYLTIFEYQPSFDNVQSLIQLVFVRMNDDIKNFFQFHLYLYDEIVEIMYLLQ